HGDAGNDIIGGGAGNDIVFGDAGNDTTSGGAGADIVFGDGGQVVKSGSVIQRLRTISPTVGGDDFVDGGTGADYVFGGAGNDTIYGAFQQQVFAAASKLNIGEPPNDTAPDVILGDNGQVVFNDGSADANSVFSTDPGSA